ncbi:MULTISPECIES: hypothetical protein [unclassified Flavobacterium]|uniref:hypothetical protein n=1 Tax=unclassified Flavobacterium TaxID=196869 RepID=UPI0011C448A9|nr:MULTISPECIES: hypothetical protein [unclassified Flavobacterium]
MKKLGIYIDQSSANLIELTVAILEKKPTNSYEDKQSEEANENHIDFGESHLQNYYFKKISEYILYYNEVLLFGTSKAITQLFDMIANDNRFYNINIAIKPTDTLTHQQQNDFVSDFFLLEQL